MASTKQQAEIAGRARRIGWPVEAGVGTEWLYKITRPTGRAVYLHQSPSDTNWPEIAIKQLNGREKLFDKAEAAWEAEHEKERRQKLAADRAAGERKLADATKAAKTRATAVQRAAGPHAVVEFEPGWLLTPHELPETRRGILVPELAAKLLDTVDRSSENRHQRSYRQRRETVFVDLIKAGEWAVTHQGMAIDDSGRLQDGQHRAGAIVTTGQPQQIMISVGMPGSNFTAVDTPLVRTSRDALDIRGETNVSILSSATRLIIGWDRYGAELASRKSKLNVSITTIDRYVSEVGGDNLRAAVRRCLEIRREIKIVGSALTAGIYLIRRTVGWDNPMVAQFFEDLETGTHIGKTDVVYLLRRVLNDPSWGRANQNATLALIIKAWNARAVGRPIKHLAWKSNEWFPATIIVPAPEDEV